MNRQEMIQQVKKQLAIDLNCVVTDFDQPGICFCPALDLPGRRPFPRKNPVFDMVTFGMGTIVSASERLLPRLRQQLGGLDRDSLWSQPFLCSLGHYFLPDPERLRHLPVPAGVRLEWSSQGTDKKSVSDTWVFQRAGYDPNDPRPDVLACFGLVGGTSGRNGGASDDCEMLWQVGVDVLPDWRERGLAAALVSQLSSCRTAKRKNSLLWNLQQQLGFSAYGLPCWLFSSLGMQL